MDVKLHVHEGKDARSGKPVVIGDSYGPQYRVYVNGIGVGYIGSGPGAKVLLTENRFSAADMEKIRAKVAELRGCEVSEIKQPPKVNPELLSRNDGIEADDLD